eukprot:159808-Hanusia_phi.AAC.5
MENQNIPIGDNEEVESFPLRVFISSFMITERPADSFEAIWNLETKLMERANDLVATFRGICRMIMEHPNEPIATLDWLQWRPLMVQLNTFLTAFTEWKRPDELKLSKRIQNTLTAVYVSESKLTPSVLNYAEIMREFAKRKESLTRKLKHVAPPDVFRNMQDAFRAKGYHVEDFDSPVVDQDSLTDTKLPVMLPGKMSKEQLAHELLLDPSYQFSVDDCGYMDDKSLQSVRDTFREVFWISLIDDLKIQPPCYTRVIKVIEKIRGGLLDMIPTQSATLRERIDTGLIRQLLQQNGIDWVSCVNLLDGMVGFVLEATNDTQRKEEVTRFWDSLKQQLVSAQEEHYPEQFCRGLEQVLAMMNNLRIDNANLRLRSVTSVIGQYGIEFMQSKLRKIYSKSADSLDRTKAWFNEYLRRTAESGKSVGGLSKEECHSLHHTMILDLVFAPIPVTQASCPETLAFDWKRLQDFHGEAQYHAVVSAMLGMAHIRLAPMGSSSGPLLDHMKTVACDLAIRDIGSDQLIESYLTKVDDTLTLKEAEILSSLTPPGQPDMPHKDVLRLLVAPPDCITNLCAKGIQSAWRLLSRESGPQQGNLINDVTRHIYPRIKKNTDKLRKVISINRQVHSERYEAMMREFASQA